MNWIVGYVFDGWNGARSIAREWGEAIDRAMDVWGDDE